ncbi:MAG: hypothetical protein IPJ20_25765 [Flammeovirgaceae bacterium]|nr:hypothetical protein [Flammeovirgaceae bacterium]
MIIGSAAGSSGNGNGEGEFYVVCKEDKPAGAIGLLAGALAYLAQRSFL